MSPINFSFCSFADNLIPKVLAEQPLDDTIFIFPTESSRQAAIREFQSGWTLSNTLFSTMEDFKEMLFPCSKPLLKEEKRTLAFYACLTPQDKEFFKINNYFQAIDLANHFFDLWEEFNEELVTENIDREYFALRDAEILDWQWQTFSQLLLIKKRYADYIRGKGLEDVIFLHKPQFMSLNACAPFKRFVFVNQFYYTGLEKKIIDRLQAGDKQVVIYYQLPQEFVDRQTLAIREFSLKDFHHYNTEKIHIIECANTFSMFISLLDSIEKHDIQLLADNNLLQNSYEHYLAFDRFKLRRSLRFTHTSIYQFLDTLHRLLQSLVDEPVSSKKLLPIQALLEAVQQPAFFSYFIRSDDEHFIKTLQEQTLSDLYRLAEDNFQYVDLDLQVFRLQPIKRLEPVRAIIALLVRLLRIRNIADLVEAIDAPDGIDIARLIARAEFEYSNIKEVFYQALSDFSAIERTGLVQQWDECFGETDPRHRDARIASGLLHLLLDYLKLRTIQLDYNDSQSGRISINTLLDTRNIQYQSVAVLNAVEGELPHAKQTPFLFTERQRKLLHLKTFDDIKLWEKYYFFRLVLNASDVFIFTRKNIEENIEVSSFVEELKLYFPAEKLRYTFIHDKFYGAVYRHLFSQSPVELPAREHAREPSFFTFPLESETDFPERQFNLTYYAFKNLTRNPFAFYIRHWAGLNEVPKKPAPGISLKLLGILVHSVVNLTWNLLENEIGDPIFGYQFSAIDRAVVEKALDQVVHRREDFYYKIPLNHTFTYFKQVMAPIIIRGVVDFFRLLHRLQLSEKRINVIPEKEYVNSEEKIYKTVVQPDENKLGVSLNVRGKADLRIENLNEQKYYIFDYKTGSYEVEQLIFYELFYYVLDNPDLMNNVYSYFYQVLDRQDRELRELFRHNRKPVQNKAVVFEQFKKNLVDILNNLSEKGFALPELRTHLDDLAEISRKDLYLASQSSATGR